MSRKDYPTYIIAYHLYHLSFDKTFFAFLLFLDFTKIKLYGIIGVGEKIGSEANPLVLFAENTFA
jgi:hypothetical protein